MEANNGKRQIGIRIPRELDKTLESHVEKIGISKAAFILQLIYRELKSELAHIPPTTQTGEKN